MYLLYKYYPAARTTHSKPGDSEKPHIIEQFTSLLLVSIVAARMICTSIVSGDNLIFTIRPQTGPNIETFWKCQVTYNCRNHCSLMICYCLTSYFIISRNSILQQSFDNCLSVGSRSNSWKKNTFPFLTNIGMWISAWSRQEYQTVSPIQRCNYWYKSKCWYWWWCDQWHWW